MKFTPDGRHDLYDQGDFVSSGKGLFVATVLESHEQMLNWLSSHGQRVSASCYEIYLTQQEADRKSAWYRGYLALAPKGG